MVLRREVEGARRAPAAHLDVGRSRRRPPARSSCGRLGTLISICAELGLDRLEPLGAGLQLVADAGHLGHQRRASPPLRLELADLLGQAVAPRLQLLGAGLDRLALGLERGEALARRERAAGPCAFEPGDHAVEVAAQQGDVEHGEVLRDVAARCRQCGDSRSGRAAADDRDAATSHRLVAQALGQREVHRLLHARHACAPTPRRARAAARSPAAPACRAPRRRRSGRRASRRRTTRGCRSSALVDHVGAACPGARPARAGGCCCELVGLPTTITTSTCRRQQLHRVLPVLRGVADVLLLRLAHVREAPLHRGEDLGRVVDRQRGLRHHREPVGPARLHARPRRPRPRPGRCPRTAGPSCPRPRGGPCGRS